MLKNKKTLIIKSLEKQFQKTDKVKFYFVKGLKEYRNTVIVKSKNVFSIEQLNRSRGVLQNDEVDYLFFYLTFDKIILW